MTPPSCYALRRVNPFLGVTQVVETSLARAFSLDGTSWQLQVLAERPEHTWGSLNRGASIKQFFRFGVWDPASGVSRVPVNPILDVGAMLEAANQLVDCLLACSPNVPFPLRDRYERWLLDAQQRPVALLGTTTKSEFLGEITDTRWQATLLAGSAFTSPLLETRGVPNSVGGSRRHHADWLERQVNERAGTAPCVRWVERQSDRSGLAVDASGAKVTGGTGVPIPAQTLPCLGLTLDWPEPEPAQLIWDYLEWNAPRLLTLPDLPHDLRYRLEEAAKHNALLVDAQHRLYPCVLNPAWIDAARVEARLRTAATARVN